MIQALIVAALILASAAYAAWSLLSPRLRLRLLDVAARGPRAARLTAALRRRAQAKLGGGCGSCPANEQAAHTLPRGAKRQ